MDRAGAGAPGRFESCHLAKGSAHPRSLGVRGHQGLPGQYSRTEKDVEGIERLKAIPTGPRCYCVGYSPNSD